MKKIGYKIGCFALVLSLIVLNQLSIISYADVYPLSESALNIHWTDYEFMYDFGEFGLAAAMKNDKLYYVNERGKVVLSTPYKGGFEFRDGLALVFKGDGYIGYINREGVEVVPCFYGMSYGFNNGTAYVQVIGEEVGDSFEGAIDKTGKRLTSEGSSAIHASYEQHDVENGPISFRENSKTGYKDQYGNVVIPAIYDWASSFSEGLAPVMQNGKWGYINTNGKVVVPFIYDDAFGFTEGLACVMQNNKAGYVDFKRVD